MAMEVAAYAAVCSKCGISYSRRKGYFPVNYGVLYKGTGYLHVCRDCIDKMYNAYLERCGDPKTAVRQMCRKLDLFWNETVYNLVERKNTSTTMMTAYISKINTTSYVGKCYDDTLELEGKLWNLGRSVPPEPEVVEEPVIEEEVIEEDIIIDDSIELTDDVIAFWGAGFTPTMYRELEQRKRYWLSKFPEGTEFDIGTEALIRQICNLEISINKERAAGKSIDKSVNALNTLLGSMSLKPTQKRDEIDSSVNETPLGVWLYKYENKRPLPEIDDDLKDVNGIRKYVSIWVRGHLAKMLGLKNSYSKMYEDEIERLSVEKPEASDDDSEDDFLSDIFSDGESNESS